MNMFMHSKMKESPVVGPLTHVEPVNNALWQLTHMFRVSGPLVRIK